MVRALSGLQKEVLSLYRSLLRATKRQPQLQQHVRREFRSGAVDVQRSDVERVEYLLRRGKKQLDTLRMAAVKHVSFTTVGNNKQQ